MPIYSPPAANLAYSRGSLHDPLPIINKPQDPDTIMVSDDSDDGDSLFDGSVQGSLSRTPSISDGNIDDNALSKLVEENDGESSLPETADKISLSKTEDEPALPGADTPAGMSATLMPHQRLGLEFLLNQEKGKHRGSILADDMGLGKTIQATALILAHPPSCSHCVDKSRKTTLVVAPLALLKQWPREIDEKTKPGHKLRVHVFHGAGKKISVTQLMKYDVVLTNYDTLSQEMVSDLSMHMHTIPIPKTLGVNCCGDF